MARQAALSARLRAAALARLHRARERLSPLVRTLNAVSPLATLDRGYAIVSREGGGILRSAAERRPGTSSKRASRWERFAPKWSSLDRRTLIPAASIRHVLIRAASIRCAALLLGAAPMLAFSYSLPRESAVPGGVKIIRLDVHGNSMPYVDADGHRALVVQDDAGWIAIIGIPLVGAARAADGHRAQRRCPARDRIHGRRQTLCQPVAQGGAAPGQSVGGRSGNGSTARGKSSSMR